MHMPLLDVDVADKNAQFVAFMVNDQVVKFSKKPCPQALSAFQCYTQKALKSWEGMEGLGTML